MRFRRTTHPVARCTRSFAPRQARCGIRQEEYSKNGATGHGIGDYDIPLIDRSGSRYIADFDGNIASGSYCIQVFCQAGSAPADGDVLVCSREILWTGAGELTAVKLLTNKAVQDRIARTVEYYDDDGQTVLLTLQFVDDEDATSVTPQ